MNWSGGSFPGVYIGNTLLYVCFGHVVNVGMLTSGLYCGESLLPIGGKQRQAVALSIIYSTLVCTSFIENILFCNLQLAV